MTDAAKPSLLDAISAAVDEATPTPAAENTNDDSTTDGVVAADTGAGDGAGAGDDGTATGDGTVTGEGDGDVEHKDDTDVDEKDPEAVKAAEAEGRARGADGKFVKRTAAEKKAAAEAAKIEADKGKTPEQIKAEAAAADAAKKAAKKEPDAVNDPIPANLKAETKARITTLITAVKTETAKAEKLNGDLGFVMDKIKESTATPAQYVEVLGVVKLINSNDPADRRKALTYLQNSAAALANQLGVVLPGVDILSQHADLKKEVELGHISRARAEELAAARNAKAHVDSQNTATTEAGRAETARVAAIEGGRKDLNDLEVELRAADKDYDAKRGPLIAMLQPALNATHPSKWKEIFKAAYAKMPAPVKANTTTTTVKPGGNQPLRANKTPAGGQAKPPGSMLEAISAAVAQAR